MIKHALVAAGAGLALTAYAEPATPRLSIDDIDQVSRASIVRQLSGGATGSSALQPNIGGMTAPQPGIVASGAVASGPAKPAAKLAAPTRARAEPVSFLGASRDESGSYVLYLFQDAIYPARVGSTLLNGWNVKAVDGYSVTVAEGKRTWKEPIRAAAPVPSASTNTVRSLIELASPLPSGGPIPGTPVGGVLISARN
ncbi:hypothetical protein [Burkholderia ambifaria]|uniref:hypothetical protein n=1 Tax=Burkholderia ambifaria TaxID=152480 RepID=UPI001FC81D6C|nr:hypothetical protein [Burkholderia ambifaria]